MYSYDYGTTFWKIKGGLFTCKCGKPNCSFSSETIQCLQIDSDNEEEEEEEEIPVQVQSKKPKVTLSPTVKLPNRNGLRTNKNIFTKSHEHTKMSSNNCSLVTTKHKINKNKSKNSTTMPKNGLLAKNKNGSKRSKRLLESRSNKILESKSIQNKLQNTTDKKRANRKILNRNMNTAIDKNVLVNKEKFTESVRITDNEVVTTYLLRPKVLNLKKKMKAIDGTVQNDTMLKNGGFQNNITSIRSLNMLNSDQDTIEILNNSNQLMDLFKKEMTDEESEIELNMSNGESVDFPEIPCISDKEYVKVKSGEVLDIKSNIEREHFLNTNKGQWSTIESLNDILMNE